MCVCKWSSQIIWKCILYIKCRTIYFVSLPSELTIELARSELKNFFFSILTALCKSQNLLLHGLSKRTLVVYSFKTYFNKFKKIIYCKMLKAKLLCKQFVCVCVYENKTDPWNDVCIWTEFLAVDIQRENFYFISFHFIHSPLLKYWKYFLIKICFDDMLCKMYH